jgi:putative Mg2+ transporter-C (MgtC) family protein
MNDISTGDELELLGRLVLAALLGAFMGLERELRGYPAGIRTLALVTLGSTLFTEVSQLMGGDDRVAAQIVTGIGFIGAGLIFREGDTVRGITTAASIWAAAAIGMAVGIELYIVAVLGSILTFAILWSRPVTRMIEQTVRPPEESLREGIDNLTNRGGQDNEVREDD